MSISEWDLLSNRRGKHRVFSKLCAPNDVFCEKIRFILWEFQRIPRRCQIFLFDERLRAGFEIGNPLDSCRVMVVFNKYFTSWKDIITANTPFFDIWFRNRQNKTRYASLRFTKKVACVSISKSWFEETVFIYHTCHNWRN